MNIIQLKIIIFHQPLNIHCTVDKLNLFSISAEGQ